MATRRARGSGSIFQRKDGRWMVSINLPTEEGRPRQRKTWYHRTKEEAEARLAAEVPNPVVHRKPRPLTQGVIRRAADLAAARERGTHTSREWHDLIYAQRHTCFYCQQWVPCVYLTKDHKVPVSRGGSDAIDNIVAACRKCNSNKQNMTADEYLELMGGER